MPGRKKSDNIGLQIRMKEALRSQLANAAADRGVSMNAELVARLERTFAEDASAGGPEMVAITNLMAGAFLRGGQRAVERSDNPKRSISEWLHDPWCYVGAVGAVVEALKVAQPAHYESAHPDPGKRALQEYLHDFLATKAGRGFKVLQTKGGKSK